MNRRRRRSALADSMQARLTERPCPDPEVCPHCPESGSCIYLVSQNRRAIMDSLLTILQARVDGHGPGLATVRPLSRQIARRLQFDLSAAPQIASVVNNVLTEVRAREWGNACTEYRLEKWNVRPVSSKVYHIDQVTVECLKWYVEQQEQSSGGTG